MNAITKCNLIKNTYLKGHLLLQKYPNNIVYPITQSNINCITSILSNLRRRFLLYILHISDIIKFCIIRFMIL